MRTLRLVRIAPRGTAAQAVAAGVEAEVEAEWTRHLGTREMEGLRRTMARLRGSPTLTVADRRRPSKDSRPGLGKGARTLPGMSVVGAGMES